MSTAKYFPPISAILPLDSLPNELGFVKDGLTALLDKIYFRDLQYSKNDRGDSAFYSLKIVSLQRIDIEIPGTGIFLILNPSHDPLTQDISEFPITLQYEWKILAYLRKFNLNTFSWNAGDMFDLALAVLGTSEYDLIERALSLFIDGPDPIHTFVDDVNGMFGTTVTYPLPGSTDPIGDVLTQLNNQAGFAGAGPAIFSLYILDALTDENTQAKIKQFFESLIQVDILEFLKELLIPKIDATLELGAGLEFPRNVLQPIDPATDEVFADDTIKSMLTFDPGNFYFSTSKGIGYDEDLAITLNYESQIGNTGLRILLDTVKLDISRTKNIPEADADGRPADFVGAYIKEAAIKFPQFWNHDAAGSTGVIRGRNLIIGTGGFSGTLSLEGETGGETSPFLKMKFGNDFQVTLDLFSITFKQNSITGSAIEGSLTIPGFKDANGDLAVIRIKVTIKENGDFDVTAYEDDGFKEILIPDILGITLKSVYFGKKDDDFYIGISGTIRFVNSTIASVLKGNFEIEKLLIWSDGRIEIEGGSIPLPEAAKIKIGPAEISITALHFGSHQQDHNGILRKYRYFGFDGGVNVNPGGVDARGDGIKFYFTVDNGAGKPLHVFLRIQSIAIDLIIPGSATEETATALISGYLAIKEAGSGTRYEGGVKFSLPKAKIAGGASMAYEPDAPAWIVDAFVELAAPIPLGATGLGIYGFRGLIGYRYLATKHAAGLDDTDTWFQYYKAPPSEGVTVAKFETPSETSEYQNPFSVGAGVSLATTPDGGKAFSMKLFLLLSLPELIYLEGKANVLGTRVGLTGQDPPFFAYLAISPDSIETGFGADYKVPDNGWILKLYAEVQAGFFFHDPSAWYINFGREDKRISARVLSIFDATAYLMLSAQGIAAGAGVSWGFKKSYAGGIVKADVGVYIEVGGRISFERPQIGGFAMVGGHVDVFLIFMGFHISIDTSLSVEAPKPFLIKGSVRLCVGVTIGFWKFKKRIEKCFNVEFIWEKDPNKDLTPVPPFNATALAEKPPLKGLNSLSGENFALATFGTSMPTGTHANFTNKVMPLDTWVDIEFKKGLIPTAVNAVIGGGASNPPQNHVELIPPKPEVRQVRHEYSITALEVKAWTGSAWVEYKPYEAMAIPAALAALATANPEDFKTGYWQKADLGYNKIRLLAQSPLSWMQAGQPGWFVPEEFGITGTAIFCEGQRRERTCINWEEVATGTVYPDTIWQQYKSALFLVKGDDGVVRNWASHFGLHQALVFDTDAILKIRLQEPVAELTLRLTTFSHAVKISYFRRVETVGGGWVYQLIEERTLSNLQLLAPVEYANEADPVSKVEVDSCLVEEEKLNEMHVTLAFLQRQLLEFQGKREEEPTELLQAIKLLRDRIRTEELKCCDPKAFDPEGIKVYLEEIKHQAEICNQELHQLEEQQIKACRDYAHFRDQFAKCFPYNPSFLSYEIYEELDRDNVSELRFRVRDERTERIILSSSTKYYSERAAVAEMQLALAAASNPERLQTKVSKRKEYYFNVVDAEGNVIARRIDYFATAAEVEAAKRSLIEVVKAATIGTEVQVRPYEPNSVPCPVCMDHLDCWQSMVKAGTAAALQVDTLEIGNSLHELSHAVGFRPVVATGCAPILDKVLALKKEFCDKYDDLYRELYKCNYATLLHLKDLCDRLTQAVEDKKEDCEEAAALIKWIIRFLEWYGKGFEGPPREEPCATLLHELCFLTVEDYNYNVLIPGQAAIEDDFGTMVNALTQSLSPIWRPDTKYLIKIGYSDKVDTNAPSTYTQYFGFRTAGPLGYYHEDANANYVTVGENPDRYALTGLRAYIDYSRSYPNADGDLVRAKPLFYRESTLLVYYTKSYVFHMFGDWPAYNGLAAITGSKLQVVVKDPIEDVAIENPPPPDIVVTTVPQGVVDWPLDPNPNIPQDVLNLSYLRNPELLNELFDGDTCWATGGDLIQPASVNTEITLHYLKPLKLYTALFNNIYKGSSREVHRYPFQTSRYGNFAAQVESYLLDDGNGNTKKAIFGIELGTVNADIDTGYDIVTGTMGATNAALAVSYADPFDRLIEGAWKLKPLDAAVTTEFNIMRQSGTGKVFAVWIRNPEPFNDPKTPDAELLNTLRVMNGAIPDSNYKVLWSKDRSQAVVMNTSKNITAANLNFRFRYVLWNGSAYATVSTVNVNAVSMNF
jgi:hypothetical protein